jgi:putative transposase
MGATRTTRNRGFSYIGFQYYSLTWCCFERQTYFTQRDHVDLVREQFLRASSETRVVNIVTSFMPDHVHQFVKGDAPDADAATYIHKAKQYSGFYFNKAFGMKLWVRKGFNHVQLCDREYRATIAYIIENPVKAGLVKRPEDYPYTGSALHTMEELIEIAYTI